MKFIGLKIDRSLVCRPLMFSDYVLRIYASQNATVTPSCPVSGPILTFFGVTFWHIGVCVCVCVWGGGGGGGYPLERQNVKIQKDIFFFVILKGLNNHLINF